MNGTSETTLSPDRTISRVQVAVMLMRFDGAYGGALFQLEVLQLVNQARADAGWPPHRRPGPHGGRPDPGGGAHDPLLPHPAGREQGFTALTEAGVAYWAAGGEHRRRLSHPRGGGGGLDGLRRPPGQHSQRGLYPDGPGLCLGGGRVWPLLGPALRGLNNQTAGKDPGSDDPGPFLWAEVWNGVILQTNGTVLTFWKNPLQTRAGLQYDKRTHTKSSTFGNVHLSAPSRPPLGRKKPLSFPRKLAIIGPATPPGAEREGSPWGSFTTNWTSSFSSST